MHQLDINEIKFISGGIIQKDYSDEFNESFSTAGAPDFARQYSANAQDTVFGTFEGTTSPMIISAPFSDGADPANLVDFCASGDLIQCTIGLFDITLSSMRTSLETGKK